MFGVDLGSSISIKPQVTCPEHHSTFVSTIPLISGCPEVLVLIIQGKMCWFSMNSKRDTNRSTWDFLKVRKGSSQKGRSLPELVNNPNSVIRIAACGEKLTVASRWECTGQPPMDAGNERAAARLRPSSRTVSLTESKVDRFRNNILEQGGGDSEALEAIENAMRDQGGDDKILALAALEAVKSIIENSEGDSNVHDDSSESGYNSENSDPDDSEHGGVIQMAGADARPMIPVCHKLVVYDVKKRSGKPQAEVTFHHDQQEAGTVRPGTPALHSSKPLVAWYSGSDIVILMNYNTNKFEQLEVRPVADSNGDKVVADRIISCGEYVYSPTFRRKPVNLRTDIHFSACGNYLHTVIVCCQTECCSSGTLIVTNQKLSTSRNDTSLLDGKSPVSSMSVPWKLSQPQRKHTRPYSLQHAFTWTAKNLYVSFSNLTISVLKVALPSKETPKSQRRMCWTLNTSERIYLPASMREVRIFYYPVGDGNAYVIPESQNFDPPVVVAVEHPQWHEVGDDGADFTTREERKALDFYEASEESFVIPVRSGLEWTDRKILNCQT